MELLNNRNIIIGLVIIVLGVVGFIIYKKYFAKDRNVIRLPGSIGGNKNCVVVQDNKNKIYAWGKLGTTKRITECPKYLDTIAI